MSYGMYGNRLVGLTGDGEIQAWDDQGSKVDVPESGNTAISFFRLSSNTMMQTLAAVKSDGGVFLGRLGQSEPLTLPQGLSSIVDIRFLPGYAEVAVALAADGNVTAWKVDNGEELQLPVQADTGISIAANGELTKSDGTVFQLTYAQTDPMDPSTGSIAAMLRRAGVIASGANYVISQDPTLVLGFPLSLLSQMVARDILAHTNNYGLATKPDLLNAVEQAAAQGETRGIASVQAAPNEYDLYSSTQYQANRITGVAEGKAEVTGNPTAYSLFTESSIMDMNLGSLMLKKRADANALDLELTIEAKDNLTTDGWQVAERITRLVSMEGVQRQFLRVRADAPYVAPNVKILAHPTLGNILTDGAGRVLYYFAADTPGGNPLFSGSSWPYVTVPAAPKADAGVSAMLASSTFGKPDGTYLTINGRPAYYYVGDSEAGQANGQGAGWVWWTIRADGVINQ
jgi:predicted lipoprotein with Yx(FWY)xxD motif